MRVLFYTIIILSLGPAKLIGSQPAQSPKISKIFKAIEKNDLADFRKLATGAHLNSRDENKWTPLIKAVHLDRKKMVIILIEKKVDLSQSDELGQDALYYAVNNLNLPLAQLLVEKGASSKKLYGENKESLLFDAVRMGDLKMVQFLLKAEPSLLDQVNTKGENALFESARFGVPDVAEFLLSAGASMITNKQGHSAYDVSKQRKLKKTQAVFEKFMKK